MKALKLQPVVGSRIFHEIIDLVAASNIPYLSEQAGVSDSTLYNWVDGKVSHPRLTTVLKVANALGYDLALQRRKSRPVLRRVK